MSRRSLLLSGLTGIVTGVVGFGAGRIMADSGGETGSAGQPPISNSDGILSLRRVKPYDLERPRMVFLHQDDRFGYGGYPDLDDFLVASDGGLVYDIRTTKTGESVSIPVDKATYLTVGLPESYGPVAEVTARALSAEPPPVLERLLDRGIRSDIDELVAANGHPPAVGELWLLTARDRPWGIGDYELAVTAGTSFAFRFRIGSGQ